MSGQPGPHLALVLTLGVALLVAMAMAGLNAIFGPRNRGRIHRDIFECGNPPRGSARERYPVKYYLVALFFLVFDVEVVFLIPWAVSYRSFLQDPSMAWLAVAEILFFLAMLILALVFVWRARALEWE
ncbi:MAG: NADH-quinone oxidoreductase subunit A [Deltaproteobacteria bacterium]|nr:NADH-quinone oxidoreductase subunit A [Deltaproteobacteria bacterium]